eukprot:g5572.t1
MAKMIAARDDDDVSQSIEQKQVISDQMVEMLQSRLGYLHQLAGWRGDGLEADLDIHSAHCTSNVPKMKPSFVEADTRRTRRHVRKGGSKEHTAADYSDKAQRALERMGLPMDDGAAKNAGAKAQRFNSQHEKMESKRLQKSEIEHELQQNLESYVTRSVENVQYRIGEFPIGMGPMEKQPKLLLSHALQRIATLGAERMLKHFTLNVLSRKLYCEAFWFTHCKHFQPDSQREQEHLLREMSATTVKLNSVLAHHKDFFYRMFPYLVASAITWGFFYVCPGSRHFYTASFKGAVYERTAAILMGAAVCPVSVSLMRKKLFPDEEVDEVEEPPTEEELAEKQQNAVAIMLADVQAGARAAQAGHAATGRGLLSEMDVGAEGTLAAAAAAADADAAPLVRRGSAAASASASASASARGAGAAGENAPPPLERFVARPAVTVEDDDDLDAPIMLVHQTREKFQAAALSPLVQSYLGHASDTGGRHGYTLLRTAPVRNCHVGGEDTFRQRPSRAKIHEQMARENRQHRAAFLKEKYGSLRRLQGSLQKIDQRKQKVLRGGVSDVGGFCLQLVQRAEALRRGDKVPASFNPSFRGDNGLVDDDGEE